MTSAGQTLQLLKILIKNSFSKISKGENKTKKGKAQKTAAAVGITVGVIGILFYMVINLAYITQAAIFAGYHQYLPYLLIFTAQFLVLFLGSIAAMNILYFSKDNSLLMSLPMKPASIFGAKFIYTYLTELAVSAIALIPMLITYGVVCITNGIALNAGFFIIGIISVVFITALPLLVLSLISMPLMYVVSFLKKRTIGNALAALLLFALGFAVYFAMIGNYLNMQEQTIDGGQIVLSPQLASLITGVANYTVFNKPIVDSMMGVNSAANFFIYFAITVGLTVVTVFLSSLFYRKGLSIIAEGSGSSPKKKKAVRVYEGQSIDLNKSFLKIELKTLTNTPTMLINSVIGVVLAPIMIIFVMGNSFFSESGADGVGAVGFGVYLIALMAGVSNQVAMVGFSREGKNLLVLKSLPISATMLVKIKLLAATMISSLTVLAAMIAYIIVSPSHNVLIALMMGIVSLSCAFGANCIALYYDLKNPNLRWQNINEIMKNNRKALRPVLITTGIGIAYFIGGLILEMSAPIPNFWKHFIFDALCLAVNVVFIVFSYKKLFSDPEGMINSIE